jgi:hypothetical protein
MLLLMIFIFWGTRYEVLYTADPRFDNTLIFISKYKSLVKEKPLLFPVTHQCLDFSIWWLVWLVQSGICFLSLLLNAIHDR